MAELRILPPAARFLKKLKDKILKSLFLEVIDAILKNPALGTEKTGDLRGVRSYDIFYKRTNYELAYTVEYVVNEETGEDEIIVVIMAGTRENFYDTLKRYWH